MRLAEVIGALSLAADLSSGLPSEKGLRTVIVATRLAKVLGYDDATSAFWVSALRLVGCLGFSQEAATYGAGDDNGLRKALAHADFDQPLRVLRDIATTLDAPKLARAAGMAKFMLDRDAPRKHASARCESAVFFARSLGMAETVVESLDVTDERFDGKGAFAIKGEDMPTAARVADVADVLEMFAWTGGPSLARTVLEQRRGRALDPQIVDAALGAMTELLADLGSASVWDAYLACEPGAPRASEDDVDRACIALGRFGDQKSAFTLVHSRRVAAIAEAAGHAAGLSDEDCAVLRQAASVHDIGRVAISTGTWDKRASLTSIDWQRVRSHSHHTDTVLRGAGLDRLADVAGATHERGRGTGYHRGVAIDNLSLLARIIASADVMAALGEDRPHRPALDDDRAARTMRDLVADGTLDARSTQAVLDARGVARGRKSAWPGGLSDREVEVVRLVAVGRTNKEIGALLKMSPRTAQRHVMNVYDKLGLESRAGLALYAVEHGLLDDEPPKSGGH